MRKKLTYAKAVGPDDDHLNWSNDGLTAASFVNTGSGGPLPALTKSSVFSVAKDQRVRFGVEFDYARTWAPGTFNAVTSYACN